MTLDQDQAAQEAELRTNLKGEVNGSFAKFAPGSSTRTTTALGMTTRTGSTKIGVKPYLELQQAAYETYNG